MAKNVSKNQDGPDSKSFEERAIDRLKEAGMRITMPRILVIRALADTDTALSAYAIHERVSQMGGRIDVVSVYRTLAALVETHLAHHIGIVDGYLACGLDHEHSESVEHAVCRSCGKIIELPAQKLTRDSINKQLDVEGFKPLEMKIEVLGLCANCA